MSNIEIHGALWMRGPLGADVLRAHLRTLTVPLGAIRGVSVGIPAVALREPATFWGSYDAGEAMIVGNADGYQGHRESFYEVRNPARAITLELSQGRFEYIVLEPSNTDPARLVRAARGARALAPAPRGPPRARPHDRGPPRGPRRGRRRRAARRSAPTVPLPTPRRGVAARHKASVRATRSPRAAAAPTRASQRGKGLA